MCPSSYDSRFSFVIINSASDCCCADLGRQKLLRRSADLFSETLPLKMEYFLLYLANHILTDGILRPAKLRFGCSGGSAQIC